MVDRLNCYLCQFLIDRFVNFLQPGHEVGVRQQIYVTRIVLRQLQIRGVSTQRFAQLVALEEQETRTENNTQHNVCK